MPIPSKRKDEDKNGFMSRCMGDEVMKKDFPQQAQRVAVCMSKATEDLQYVEAADFQLYFEQYGSEEELTEDNFYIPHPEEYLTMAQIRAENYGYASVKVTVEEDDEEDDMEEEDDTETEDEEEEDDAEAMEWDIAKEKPGLWENIRKKREREGKNYKPAKKGDPDRPDPEAWKQAQSKFKYKDPQTGEYFYYQNQGVKEKDGKKLVFVGKAEYQGRTVQLGKPFRTPDGPKKFSVYVKNDRGNVVKVNFGDPNMKIKKNIPERRKSFRARHNCDNPGPRWKARYWSCKAW
jgi:hypothetical protein